LQFNLIENFQVYNPLWQTYNLSSFAKSLSLEKMWPPKGLFSKNVGKLFSAKRNWEKKCLFKSNKLLREPLGQLAGNLYISLSLFNIIASFDLNLCLIFGQGPLLVT